MTFKKQERAQSLWCHCFALHYLIRRITLKAWEIQLTTGGSWVKTPYNANHINQKVPPRRNPPSHPRLGSALFSSPLCRSSAFGSGLGYVCSPCQTLWNGICLPWQTGGQAITERALPGCRPLGYAALWRPSARPHIWPCGLAIWRPTLAAPGGDSSGQLVWSCTGRQRGAGEGAVPSHCSVQRRNFWARGLCNSKMAAPNISALASSLFSGWTRPWERNFGLLRLYILLNVSFCTYYMHQEQISQAFFPVRLG